MRRYIALCALRSIYIYIYIYIRQLQRSCHSAMNWKVIVVVVCLLAAVSLRQTGHCTQLAILRVFEQLWFCRTKECTEYSCHPI
jgi:hypothetical protein